jgi:hypothetical protein
MPAFRNLCLLGKVLVHKCNIREGIESCESSFSGFNAHLFQVRRYLRWLVAQGSGLFAELDKEMDIGCRAWSPLLTLINVFLG